MIVRYTCLALGLASATAYGGTLRVHAERCPTIDGAALETAVDRELALAPARAPSDALTVEVACADGIHAKVRITPGALARELDLSEEPSALRVKLLALAIAELVATLDAPEPPLAGAVADTETPPAPLASLVASRDLSVRAGVRVMGWDHFMSTLAADLDLGPLRVGVTTAVGHERYGMPLVVEATVGRALVCSAGATSVCLVARGAIGVYGISLHTSDGDIMDQSLYGAFYDASLGIEARRRIAGWNWIAGFDVGAGDGLMVEQDYLERFDGPFAAATFGASW